jgi:hypothetical protein
VPDRESDAAPSEELAGIVARAGRLGFSTTRVATALGISADGLAAIQPRIAESAWERENGRHSGNSTPSTTHHGW